MRVRQTLRCKPLANVLGLERTDNNMELSSWPVVAPINQKNYYTYALHLRLID
jgi:hypothetical protein